NGLSISKSVTTLPHQLESVYVWNSIRHDQIWLMYLTGDIDGEERDRLLEQQVKRNEFHDDFNHTEVTDYTRAKMEEIDQYVEYPHGVDPDDITPDTHKYIYQYGTGSVDMSTDGGCTIDLDIIEGAEKCPQMVWVVNVYTTGLINGEEPEIQATITDDMDSCITRLQMNLDIPDIDLDCVMNPGAPEINVYEGEKQLSDDEIEVSLRMETDLDSCSTSMLGSIHLPAGACIAGITYEGKEDSAIDVFYKEGQDREVTQEVKLELEITPGDAENDSECSVKVTGELELPPIPDAGMINGMIRDLGLTPFHIPNPSGCLTTESGTISVTGAGGIPYEYEMVQELTLEYDAQTSEIKLCGELSMPAVSFQCVDGLAVPGDAGLEEFGEIRVV
ncbi:MAG: hypothetical protein EB168_11330, partial [Euryarchaeota archaeon]|nr:hypothetical protein [Euryarchaeota archaeon]